MILTHGTSGKPFTKYAASVFGSERETIDDAWPGDVIGLVNASGLRVGDSLYESSAVTFPPIPAFPPELIATAHPRDLSRSKQFKRGLAQLEQEGVGRTDPPASRSLDDSIPSSLPPSASCSLDVLQHRMEHEPRGGRITDGSSRPDGPRGTDELTAEKLRAPGVESRCSIASDGALLALFQSPYWPGLLASDHSDWTLEQIVTIVAAEASPGASDGDSQSTGQRDPVGRISRSKSPGWP